MSETEKDSAYGRDQVVKIINSVISKVGHNDDSSREAVFQELKELQKIIEDARKEIGSSQPSDIKDKHIPTATDELDAVVEATAEATGKIMDSCEAVQDIASAVGGDHENALGAEVIKIFEACSFQDITGQRITKVVTTLKVIEGKVDKLVAVLGSGLQGMESSESSDDDEERTGDEALLNGPQMSDQAISQEEIDRLLEEFD